MRKNWLWVLVLGIVWGFGVQVQAQCIAYINEDSWINGDVHVSSPWVSGQSYAWSVQGAGCSVTPNGNQAVVHRPPGVNGVVCLTVTQTGCNDNHCLSLTPNPMPYMPLIGDSVVCGSNPMLYECTWNAGGGTASCYNHIVSVTGGTILSITETLVSANTYHEKVWVSWGAGPVGTIRSTYSFCTFPAGTIWTENIAINCGLAGSHYACVGTAMPFKQNCPPGSTFSWSTTNGTVVSGQNSDSVNIVWNSPGVDTLVTIFNSTVCGLDTNYFPVTVLNYPSNQIFGDSTACENTVDTFSTSLLPLLNPPAMTKVWQVTGGGLNLNAGSVNEINYLHGLGPSETIVLVTDDHGCISRDTLNVSIHPAPGLSLPSYPVICTGDSLLLDVGPGFGSYAWSTGATTSAIFANAAVPYMVSVTDPMYNCLGSDTVTPTIDPDCVWPGDANHDYVVDLNDFLDIGVAFGDMGPMRPNAFVNWNGQPSANWANSFLSGENHKHADTDGDGVVDFPDTVAVTMYQGFTHLRVGRVEGGIPLRIRPRIPFFAGQDTVELIVELGEFGFPADSSYGLAFQLDFAPSDVFPGVYGKVVASYFGAPGGGMLMATGQRSLLGGPFPFAMVRTDHRANYGYGEVARIYLKAQPGLWTGQTQVQLPLALSHCRLIRPDGSDLLLTPAVDTVWLYDLGYVAAPEPEPAGGWSWSVSPNPASEVLEVRVDGGGCAQYEVSLTDMSGRVVAEKRRGPSAVVGMDCIGGNVLDMDLRGLSAGVYVLRMDLGKGGEFRRVVVR